MNINIRLNANENSIAAHDITAADNLEQIEDRLVEICDQMERNGHQTLEIASSLIFVTHYLLCRDENNNTTRDYHYLLKQCQSQIDAMHELKK